MSAGQSGRSRKGWRGWPAIVGAVSGPPDVPAAVPVALPVAVPVGPPADDVVSVVVSVVVIVYNDAARLPAAVASALAQQLPRPAAEADHAAARPVLEVVVVDDASTDATPQVCAELAADPRVRVLRRSANSGGCSAPRNDGMEAARGRWVMFLDSDDVLPPGAVAALVGAGEASHADVASGLCQRVYLDSGAVRPWCPELYSRPRILAGIDDEPTLWRDSLSTNKAYRRTFLEHHRLRFPLGMHFEDLVFSARVYLAASRIALVPDPVYRWLVAGEDVPAVSISMRRHSLDSLRDRVRAHELIDEALATARPADARLRAAKDAKFVESDLRLYLDDLWRRDDDYRSGFLELLQPYLRSVPDSSWRLMTPLPREAAAAVRAGDLDAAQDVVERLRRADRRSLTCLARLDTIDERRPVASVVLVGGPGEGPERLSVDLVPVVAGLAVPRRVWLRRPVTARAADTERRRWELELVPPPVLPLLPVSWRLAVAAPPLVAPQTVAPPRLWREPPTVGRWTWDVSRGGDVQLSDARSRRWERRVDAWRRRWRWTSTGRLVLAGRSRLGRRVAP